jgi:hypothetical protein
MTTEQLLSTVKELHSLQKNTQYGCNCQAGCTSLLAKAEDVLQSPATKEHFGPLCNTGTALRDELKTSALNLEASNVAEETHGS